MASTTEIKANPGEVKLLLALINSTKLPSVPWVTVATGLNCNGKAVQERWRKFKIKLTDGGDKPVTAAEIDLLLAIVSAIQLSGIDWGAVSTELGCNNKAARERWRKFKLKSSAKAEGNSQKVDASGAPKKDGEAKAAGKTFNGGGAKKRKIEEEAEEETGEDASREVRPVGDVNRPVKKHARVVKQEKVEEQIVEDGEGEGPEFEI